MRYIKFSGGTDYCGTEFEEVDAFEGFPSDEMIDGFAVDLAHDNAESYEYLGEFETEEERDNYYESAYCDWEEITKEEYDEFRKLEGY